MTSSSKKKGAHKDDELVFPNAEILVPAPEWAFWMDDGKMSRAKDPVKSWFLNARRIFGL